MSGQHLGPNVTTFTLSSVPFAGSTGANIFCYVRRDTKKYNGTVLFVSKILEEPKDFSCETQDFQTLTCAWEPGVDTRFTNRPTAQSYTLIESFSGAEVQCQKRNTCEWQVPQESRGVYNFTLVARNDLRTRRVSRLLHLAQQVKPKPPSDLFFANISATSAVVAWKVGATWNDATLLCEVALHSEGRVIQQHNVSVKVTGECYLRDLEPNTNYQTKIRCAAAKHFWKWSDVTTRSFTTPEAAPSEAPDVWRSVSSASGNQTVALFWKPLSKQQAQGKIRSYSVAAENLHNPSESVLLSVPAPGNGTVLTLQQSPYRIKVTASNGAGSSPASVFVISGGAENYVTEERVNSSERGIALAWSRPPGEVTGYVVQWCEPSRELPCRLRWESLGPNSTSTVISSDALRPGVRYNFKIYGISANRTAHLLEWKKGYSQEMAPSNPLVTVGNLTSHSFALSWKNYSLDSDSQPGFIRGYHVYLQSKDKNCHKGFEKTVLSDGLESCKYTINNPEQRTFVVENLQPELYEFLVTSFNSAGEGPHDPFRKVMTPNEHYGMLTRVLIPMILGVFVTVALCCLRHQWVKENCCPAVPDPCKSTAVSTLPLKGNSPRTILTVKDCIPDAIEVLYKLDRAKMQVSKVGESLPDAKLSKPLYLPVLPTGNSPSPAPCICFENLTYNQGAADSASSAHGPVLPGASTEEPGPEAPPAGLPDAQGRTDVKTPLGGLPTGDAGLNYVSQLASQASEDQDSPCAHSPQPVLCTAYRMQMAIPLLPLRENASPPSATIPKL
ncbi:oncostatin-M-specific receptor subunit beta [Erinaceus europaeus]|uniref:Oncostatin-M-specific receptor subunit beta n=1 Tax=Erinaceus europaeus TaxID=9365 RepID=A0ABM3XDQ4_ERIEU|nr:oncostatin-M-specific receptor subunit beta [Erinaceus europaeus]